MSLTLEQEEKLSFMLSEIGENRKVLNDWEQGFYDDQCKRFDEYGAKMSLSGKQWAVLIKMHEKATDTC